MLLTEFTHVRDRWDDAVADTLDPVERLVYRSNLLGSDWRITNTGGGNTSSKLTEHDPLTGKPVTVLWVKGSGGDLRTATREHFSSLYMDRFNSLREVYARFEERGPKTPAEDAMPGLYGNCTFNMNTRPPSIDTPFHAFIPYTFVDHVHPDSIIALATAVDGPALTHEIFGDKVVWVPWVRPGFELGLIMEQVCADNRQAVGAVLGGHGLIAWSEDDRECHLLTLSLIERAAVALQEKAAGKKVFGGERIAAAPEDRRREVLLEILPWLRGRLADGVRMIGTVEVTPGILEFVGSEDASRLAELGTSCPDHFIRTKIKPLWVDWDPATEDLDLLKQCLESGLVAYKADYRAYYEACKHPDSPAIRGENPTVVLIPGIGMIAWGKTKSESRVTAEFYRCAIEVMRGAEGASTYTALDRQEAFDIEYWSLEEAKLRRMPPEDELARQIAVVVGAGSGIGRRVVERLVRQGAVVAALDLDPDAARATADSILERMGMGIGVAGTGISGCGDVIGLGCDMTDRASVRSALEEVLFAYGGIDHVVVTAGRYVSPDTEGRISDEAWEETFRANVIGPRIVAEEAARIWEAQGLPGSFVMTTSVNAVVPKKGSVAYDTSKAAANHLVRELAVEFAPLVRVNGVAPATVVAESGMFPRDRVIASLAKYGLSFADDESTELLRDRLAAFYAERTLLGKPILPEDQAEAVFLLVSGRLSKTTGQVITVDGGLPEAFLR